jgi:hypothetical protein
VALVDTVTGRPDDRVVTRAGRVDGADAGVGPGSDTRLGGPLEDQHHLVVVESATISA